MMGRVVWPRAGRGLLIGRFECDAARPAFAPAAVPPLAWICKKSNSWRNPLGLDPGDDCSRSSSVSRGWESERVRTASPPFMRIPGCAISPLLGRGSKVAGSYWGSTGLCDMTGPPGKLRGFRQPGEGPMHVGPATHIAITPGEDDSSKVQPRPESRPRGRRGLPATVGDLGRRTFISTAPRPRDTHRRSTRTCGVMLALAQKRHPVARPPGERPCGRSAADCDHLAGPTSPAFGSAPLDDLGPGGRWRARNDR